MTSSHSCATFLLQVISVFQPWKEKYNIQTEYWPGQKHQPAMLGFDYSQMRAYGGGGGGGGGTGQQGQMEMGQMGQMGQPQMLATGVVAPAMQANQGGYGGGYAIPQGQGGSPPGYVIASQNPPPPLQAQAPGVEQVEVRVPIYGGGGTSMVEYNGHLINVDVPADAKAGSTIMVEVPDMYKKSNNSGFGY